MKFPVAYVASGRSYTRRKTSTWNMPKTVVSRVDAIPATIETTEKLEAMSIGVGDLGGAFRSVHVTPLFSVEGAILPI